MMRLRFDQELDQLKTEMNGDGRPLRDGHCGGCAGSD